MPTLEFLEMERIQAELFSRKVGSLSDAAVFKYLLSD